MLEPIAKPPAPTPVPVPAAAPPPPPAPDPAAVDPVTGPPAGPFMRRPNDDPSAPFPEGTSPTDDDAPKPKPGKPFSWKKDFEALDKNEDGKLAKSELKLAGAKGTDLDKDGEVTLREFRSANVKANSFEGLDKNDDGTLDAKELSKMRRFDDRQYGDGEAPVTKAQFEEARRGELHANRIARMKERFEEGLTKEEAKKMERFAGEDGKLDADEFVKGRIKLRQEWHEDRQDKLFERAGGEKGVLDVTSKEGKAYAAYDTDGDGKVSRKDFAEGYMKDLHDVEKARRLDGELKDEGLRARLNYAKDGFADKIEMPTGAGDAHERRNDWFISQYGTKYNTNEDVPGWDNANCGPTSLTMVAEAFGKIDVKAAGADAAIERSRRLMGDAQSERDGTSADGVARGAREYGLDADIIPNVSLKQIEAELAKGRIPIVNGNVIRPDGSYGGGHFYTVTKIEDGKAYLNDPYSKTGPSVVPVERLMHSINTHFAGRVISVGDPKKD